MQRSIIANATVDTAKILLKGGVAGAIAGGASYFLMKRRDAVEILGMEMPQFAADLVLVALGSITGRVVGQQIGPWVESKLGASDNMKHWTRMAIPPITTGVVYAGVVTLVEVPDNNEYAKNIMLGAVSDVLSDRLIDSLYQ
jgi:predicted aconitase